MTAQLADCQTKDGAFEELHLGDPRLKKAPDDSMLKKAPDDIF